MLRKRGCSRPKFRYIERTADTRVISARNHTHFSSAGGREAGQQGGSSVGISIVGGYVPIVAAIEKLFADGASGVVVEEYIRGKEVAASVVEGLRGEKLYTLPPVEIIPPDGDFFSYDAKYSGRAREVCPGKFSRVTTEELQRAAKVAHGV